MYECHYKELDNLQRRNFEIIPNSHTLNNGTIHQVKLLVWRTNLATFAVPQCSTVKPEEGTAEVEQM